MLISAWNANAVRPIVLSVICCGAAVSAALPCCAAEVDYSRDIRPILATHCFKCHGADESHREGGLRLDTHEGATAVQEGRAAIVSGKPADSELIHRVTSADPDQQMPPADAGSRLSNEQIDLLRQWIVQGAAYQQHWAFTPPQRPPVPELTSDWLRNPIDAFVLQRLQQEQLSPSAEAGPETLLRRLSLDLTGLPPSIAELDAFVAEWGDSAADRASTDRRDIWSRQVDRLLASPHFGEKWGRHWLDAARYADSDGFEKDKPRFVWFYRDWVVNSLNSDKPYDQFLIEQLAGDLLPQQTQDQLVATGFLRNSMINEEGGVDPEQFRMEAMFDRMDAIGKAMLGLTIQCCQCHNHKYDPLTQTDYYRLFAFLNNSDEAQATVYTPQEQAQREAVLTQTAELESQLQRVHPDWPVRMEQWVRQLNQEQPDWKVVRPELDASGGQKHYLLDDGSVLAQGYAPTKHTTEFTVESEQPEITGFRLELLNDDNLPHGGPGRSVDGLCALSEFQVVAEPRDRSAQKQNVKLTSATASVNPPERELAVIYGDKSKNRRVTGPISYAMDGDQLTAWGIDIGGGRSNVPQNAVFVPEKPLKSASGFRLTFRLVQMHGGWNSDDNQNNNLGRFRFSVTSQTTPQADPVPPSVRRIAAISDKTRRRADQERLFSSWRTTVPEFAAVNQQIESLWQSHPRGTTQLVLHERQQRRPTWVLTRGDFLKPADPVTPGIPELFGGSAVSLASPSGHAESPRLQFARWITDRSAPTTARAAVNRIWQEYFGTGLVQTSEDLGTQGEYPSHPELLDWLAVELMDHQWSLKHIHRLIATSATYRQASLVTADLHARDPQNRLLARGPRFRVSGEGVRDLFLAASGLLNPAVGGPGVYPPAPEFLFQPPASYGPKTWPVEQDSDRYRRAIYTFRFRSVPYPVLQNFDTPRGDTACVRRSRSNTPLQALTTLNEDLFMDCGRALALAALELGGQSDNERIHFLMRRCVARRATDFEQQSLREFLDSQRRALAAEAGGDDQKLWQLAALDPAAPPALPKGATPLELAVWTATARVVLNLDETISKE